MKRAHGIEVLKHALIGYQSQAAEIQKRIAELRRRLGTRAVLSHDGLANSEVAKRDKPRISKTGRARIAAATSERWRKARAAGRTTLG